VVQQTRTGKYEQMLTKCKNLKPVPNRGDAPCEESALSSAIEAANLGPESGNILAKQLSFLANADSAGLVLGARVPIILTSRADSVRARIASCGVAMLAAHARRKKA
jgi:hypothetical protein